MGEQPYRIGLVVRSGPYAGRSGRDQLDLALSAATLGFHIELFFLGDAALQLLGELTPEAAGLPGGVRGWRSLPELTAVQAWVPDEKRQRLQGMDSDWALELQFAPSDELAGRLASCDRVMVA